MTEPASPSLTPEEIAVLVELLGLATSVVKILTGLVPYAPYVLEGLAVLVEDIAEPIVEGIKVIVCG
jgi:hypothetical protein